MLLYGTRVCTRRPTKKTIKVDTFRISEPYATLENSKSTLAFCISASGLVGHWALCHNITIHTYNLHTHTSIGSK